MSLVKKDRLITGIALALGAVLIAVIDNIFIIWLLFGVMLLVANHEMQNLLQIKNDTSFVLLIGLWIGVYFFEAAWMLPLVVALLQASYGAYKKDFDAKQLLILIYPTISFVILFLLYKEFGIFSLVLLVLIVALSDTGAYFSGKLFGKTPFSPTSPNKTIEGFLGGLIVATVVGSLMASSVYPFIFSLIFSFVVSATSTFGDLFESYLKREAGVKDSGNILPGHGGILDRMDGYLFSCIVAYFLLLQI